MKQIKLFNNEVTLVDDEDHERLSRFKWHTNKKGYVLRSVYENGKVSKIFMHNEIMNPDHDLLVDHKDHNKLNNQKSNYRICTNTDNAKNRSSQKSSTSKYLGVSFKNANKKWIAQISFNNKVVHLGCFKNEEDAAKAYDEAAKKYHDEFANLNFN